MVDETCANCGERIGKLQTAYIFNDKIVCHKCNTILNDEYYPSKPWVYSPPLQAAPSSDLQQINKSTHFLATVVWIIIILVVIGVVLSLIAAGVNTAHLQKEYDTLLGVK